MIAQRNANKQRFQVGPGHNDGPCCSQKAQLVSWYLVARTRTWRRGTRFRLEARQLPFTLCGAHHVLLAVLQARALAGAILVAAFACSGG